MEYNKVKARMTEKKITQEQLAAQVGMCETTMNKKLNGRTEFTAQEIGKIAEVLEIVPFIYEYFFYGNTSEN